MADIDLDGIIEALVHNKAIQLSTWKKVRWQGGRVFYEVKTIEYEIRNYNIETKILYLEKLLDQDYIVQDNLPSTAPIVTHEFNNEIQVLLADLKIQRLQSINSTRISKRRRPTIAYKVKTLLQKEISSKCPFCRNEDVDHFQIHHIDENPENNDFSNLLMICPNCHSKITKGDINKKQVLVIKKDLIYKK